MSLYAGGDPNVIEEGECRICKNCHDYFTKAERSCELSFTIELELCPAYDGKRCASNV